MRFSRSHSDATARRMSVSSAAASVFARSSVPCARVSASCSARRAAARRAAASASRRSSSRALRLGAIARVELREKLRDAARLLGPMALGARDEPWWQSEPGGDGQRPALAWTVVDEAEGRRQGDGVEFHRGVPRAWMGGGKTPQRLQMGGRDNEGTALGQLFEDRLRQRRPLVGIRAGTQLVEQNEGAAVGLVEHLPDLLHERRERRQILGHRLVVADDGVEPREDRQS